MKNRSLLKKAVLAVLLISSLTFSGFSQNASVGEGSSTAVEWENSENYFSGTSSVTENTTVTDTGSTGSSVWVFVRMILFLVIFVAAIYGVIYLIKRKQNKIDNDDEFLRRVSHLTLGQGKTVEIITLIDKAYLVGVSDAGINLIAEITDKELIDAMNVYADKTQKTTKSRSFADVLELFMPRGGAGGTGSGNGQNGGNGQSGGLFGNVTNTGLADLIKKSKEGGKEE